MAKTFFHLFAILLSAVISTNALAPQPTRRDMIRAGWGAAAASASLAFINANPTPAYAAEDNQVLTDDEMAARIARKQELLRRAKAGSGQTPVSATDIRSDVNPDAAVNLRNRSLTENAKNAMEKQAELKSRDKAQKREDLCEMLGRGC